MTIYRKKRALPTIPSNWVRVTTSTFQVDPISPQTEIQGYGAGPYGQGPYGGSN